MRGSDTFSSSALEQIRVLLRRKERAPYHARKGVRDQLRALRLYSSDFKPSRAGMFTEADLDALLESGRIVERPER